MNRRSRTRSLLNILIAVFMIAASGVQASDNRAETLGESLICMCGCNQLLSACEMINCPKATPMRKELKALIDEGNDDKTILASFKAKFGPAVLSAPPTGDWFNLSAWIMPFAVLGAGGAAVVFAIRRRRATETAEGPALPDSSKFDGELEAELRRLHPED